MKSLFALLLVLFVFASSAVRSQQDLTASINKSSGDLSRSHDTAEKKSTSRKNHRRTIRISTGATMD